MLNCGMLPKDIADLKHEEVDWTAGTIKRKRSKTKGEKSVPVVTYKLWSQTLDLLKEYRSADPVFVLLTEKGGRWITEGTKDNGEFARSDMVGSNLKYWKRRAKVKRPTKNLRTTAATKLGEHKEYKFYAQYFLGQSPKTVADKQRGILFEQLVSWVNPTGRKPTHDDATIQMVNERTITLGSGKVI
jgi:integrase